jgi:Zn ribbon nucleic-acid-binding protein
VPYATFHLAQGTKRAQWLPIEIGHRRSATVRCPDCGTAVALLDYSISIEGDVQPAFECVECSFHEHVVLRGWGD